MLQDISRRGALRVGAGSALGLLSPRPGGSEDTRQLEGLIFCHTMGAAADIVDCKVATGLDVDVTCWRSNIDTLDRFTNGAGRQFDVFNLSQQFVPEAVRRGLVAPLDFAKIPNAHLLSAPFANPAYSRSDGRFHSLPFMFGFDSVVYNQDQIGPVDSYGVLFDDAYKGRVALRDDAALTIAQTALFLGHTDPWNLQTADLRRVTDFLIAKKPNFRTLWAGFTDAVSLLDSEEVVAVGDGWISMAWTLNRGGTRDDFAIAIPKEKPLVWTQDWLMPVQAIARGREEAVYDFMNWSIGGAQAASMGRHVGYVSPSSTALHVLSPEEQTDIGYDDYQEILRSGLPMNQLPDNFSEWLAAWSRFKNA